MSTHDTRRTRVDCTECHFTVLVAPGDEKQPAENVIEHGRETGHTLSTTSLEELQE